MATILCVEDEAHIREDIVESMENAGHTVLQACDGQQGLEMIVENAPDMVVSDITMPKKDGLQLLDEVRGTYPRFADMPFIFLSALADRENVLDGLKLGADDYITKPIDFEMLAYKVEATLRQIERMQALKEEQFLKLFNALSGDAEAAPAIEPVVETKPETVDTMERSSPEEQTVPATDALQQPTAMSNGNSPEKQAAPAPDATPQPPASDNNRRKIFGSIFQFNNFKTAGDQLGDQRKGILDWLDDKACCFLNRILPNSVSVAKIPDGGGIMVCYQDGDKDKADTESKRLAIELEDHLHMNQLDELAEKTSIDREKLTHLVVVTQMLYETEIELEHLEDPDRFSAAIKEQIDKIYFDESAPTRLSASIKQNNGHLVPLTFLTEKGGKLPITFFSFDEASRQKIKASFALFGRANRIKAGYLIDLLTLGFLEVESRKIDKKDTVVVDVHFETLMSDECLALYLSAYMKFVNNSQHTMVMNIRAIPSGITSLCLDEMLGPFGKHAARRIVQIEPQMFLAHANAQLPVSSIVCSYSDLLQSESDISLFLKAKEHLSKAGILLVLRGLPSENEIDKFSKYGFDGYAVNRG